MDNMMSLLEERGIDLALWPFDSSWTGYTTVADDFEPLHAPNPSHHADVFSSLGAVNESYWSRNAKCP